MHYYKRNLGDYAKKCGRLNMLQHGAYTLLIDACYDRETFPTTEEAIEWTWASTDAEIEAVRFVLSRFFKVGSDGRHVQDRILSELLEYHEKADKNKRIAIDRETKRREVGTKRDVESTKRAPRLDETPPNQEPLTINHKPRTINQEPIGTGTNVPSASTDALAGAAQLQCPQDEIRALFTEKLPHLPQARVWGTDRQKELRARWAEAAKLDGYATKEAGLAWWSRFFADFERSNIGHGTQGDGRVWVPDLQWILKRSNFEKILNGRYASRSTQPGAPPPLNRQEALEARNREVARRYIENKRAGVVNAGQ